MRIFKIFLFITLCMSLITLPQKAVAVAFTLNPTDDLTIIKGMGFDGDSTLLTAESPLQAISYLKFDVSSIPTGYTINPVSLHLYGHSSTDNNSVAVYNVSNDNWDEINGFSWNTKPTYSSSSDYISTEGQSGFEAQWYTWDLSSYNFNPYVQDGFLSFALEETSPYPWIVSAFQSKNTGLEHQPQLLVNTAPVPEPSTMLLGILGLGGVLIRRRKSTVI